MKYTIILFIFIMGLGCSSIEKLNSDKSYFYLEVDELPKFNGDLNEFIYSNLEWPEKFDGADNVLVSFVVSNDGNVEKVRIEKALSEATKSEVKKLFEKMPKWAPGKLKGRNVNVQLYLPIKFILK